MNCQEIKSKAIYCYILLKVKLSLPVKKDPPEAGKDRESILLISFDQIFRTKFLKVPIWTVIYIYFPEIYFFILVETDR
jgi:hypothetical protein